MAAKKENVTVKTSVKAPARSASKRAAKPASSVKAAEAAQPVASGVGRYRVLNAKVGLGAAGDVIRLSNARAAERVEAGEIERV